MRVVTRVTRCTQTGRQSLLGAGMSPHSPSFRSFVSKSKSSLAPSALFPTQTVTLWQNLLRNRFVASGVSGARVRGMARWMSTESGGKGAGPKGANDGDKGVSNWLLGVSGLVFGMVVIGGLTRLTKSGLSMTDWKLLGQLPPMTTEGWRAEFAKYQASPEFRVLHSDMQLSEFKFIYWMEYGHRQLGRVIGVAFAVPFAYYLYRGRLQRLPGIVPRATMILGMIGCQGLIGWWMVKSGLVEPTESHQAPRVSPYRLATHLLSAFAIYTMLFTTALRARFPTHYLTKTLPFPGMSRLAMGAATAVGVTAASGAFVAGNGAGLCYNEWPLMGGSVVPQDIINPYLKEKWRNMFENSSLVQFEHRMLGQGTFLLIVGTWVRSQALPLLPTARIAGVAMMGVAFCQVALGISTLLLMVPTPLAATHQAGSLTLLTASLCFVHALRQPLTAAKVAKQAAKATQQQVGSMPLRALHTARRAVHTTTVTTAPRAPPATSFRL